MLEIITTRVIKKIVGLLFIEISPKNSVIFDLLSPSILIFSVDNKFIRVGNNVNVIKKDVIKPKDIIQPKSITGFISLKIKDKNAQIVVKAV